MNPQHSEARRREIALMAVGVGMFVIVVCSVIYLARRQAPGTILSVAHDLPPTGGAASAFTEAAGPPSSKSRWGLRNGPAFTPPPAAPERSIQLAVEEPTAPFSLETPGASSSGAGRGLTTGGSFGVVDWARLFAADQRTTVAESELSTMRAAITERMNDLQEGGFAREADYVRSEGEKQLNEQSKQAREKISSEIQAAVGRVAQRHGFALVLDSSAKSLNAVPVLLAHRTYADVTEEVERELKIGQGQ